MITLREAYRNSKETLSLVYEQSEATAVLNYLFENLFSKTSKDLILHGDELDEQYMDSLKTLFLEKCLNHGLNIDFLKYVTKSLIFGTYHALPENASVLVKNKIWELIKVL